MKPFVFVLDASSFVFCPLYLTLVSRPQHP